MGFAHQSGLIQQLVALQHEVLIPGSFLLGKGEGDAVGTLRALGLRGIGQTNVLPDRPEIHGMIARVPHLVRVEEVN